MIPLDDAALEALSNKGVLRRAKADLGLARVIRRDAMGAEVEIEGLRVTLTAKGLRAQDCPCPATGICRHLVTAALALREEGPQALARDDLLALTEAQIADFAGADLAAAVALSTAGITALQDQSTLTVTLGDLAPVQFLAGLGLRGAVFKGPVGRKRLAVTAAALGLRATAGLVLTVEVEREALLPEAFLTEVAGALERLFTATLRGGAALACDQVFDLAISARAMAAPRLTGELRALVAEAETGAARDIAFDAEAFARSLSRSYALVHALMRGQDAALTGVLRRTYAEAPALTLAMLGAQVWHSASGARGVTAYGLDLASGTWVSAMQARAAGADPGFDAQRAYGQPMLSGLSPQRMTGHEVTLPAPRLSADRQLALSSVVSLGERVALDRIAASGALHDDWTALRADCARRMPSGLRGQGRAVPVLLRPDALRRAGFDDLDQRHRLALTDASGAVLPLSLAASQGAVVDWLERNRPLALLCLAGPGLRLTPVSALWQDKTAVAICNFGLDALPKDHSGMVQTLHRALTRVRGQRAPLPQAAGALMQVTGAVVRALVDLAAQGTDRVQPLIGTVEAQGLTTLAQALHRVTPDAGPVLRAIYLADRLEALGA